MGVSLGHNEKKEGGILRIGRQQKKSDHCNRKGERIHFAKKENWSEKGGVKEKKTRIGHAM